MKSASETMQAANSGFTQSVDGVVDAPPCVVKELSAAYRDRLALSQVSFTVPKGEIMAILGPNGAGKSTLIKAMLELIPRVSGEAEFFGKNIGKVRKKVAYMPQSASIDWDFPARVKDVVLMGTYARLGWLRRPGKAEHDTAQAAMEHLEIADLANRQISELSGGQKQRTFVARALAAKSDLLVMDEPFAGVDMKSEQTILHALRSLAESGKTVLLVHHDLATVRDFCSSVVLLREGQLVAAGSLATAFTSENISRAYGIDGALA
ncbi:metal ABC transporter ATP-binding protein [Arcanobacterium hippocoleae]|uniref:Manganese/zinc/iron transport system ATP-binding protein n=1 Tax=Arcanobacterium hippocoleae TaxID=149017 RepID=A0ABU1T1A5_9ACTO|nr:metal ABC transporter ATP-binding protein [Arcanobacterium hippocoleae]MDR6939132.1 manganese/zinc/iron transport system ATP- binding protein [Arcanobacterium hippocoleae]